MTSNSRLLAFSFRRRFFWLLRFVWTVLPSMGFAVRVSSRFVG